MSEIGHSIVGLLDFISKVDHAKFDLIHLLLQQLKRVQNKQNFVGWALPRSSRV
jgi:hypothetical protein